VWEIKNAKLKLILQVTDREKRESLGDITRLTNTVKVGRPVLQLYECIS
jgi:hypothetical protein